MDIFSYLQSDHQLVKGLMEKLCVAHHINERRNLYITIREELTTHGVTEEITFYQWIMEHGTPALQQKMKYSELEHDDIEHLLRLLDITDIKSDKWLILFGQLQYCVEKHTAREETEIFDAARKLITNDQSAALIIAMQKLKKQKAFRNVA